MTNQQRKDKILKQFNQSLMTRIVMIIIRLVRNAILARVLGPADRGIFSLLSSLPELIMTAGNCGIANSATYHTANGQFDRKKLFANVNFTLLALGLVLLGVSIFWVHQGWLVKDDVNKILPYRWYIAGATVLVLYKVVNVNLLNVLNRVIRVNLNSLLESLLPLIFFLLFWWVMGIAPLMAAVYAWLTGLLVVTLLSTVGRGFNWRLRFDPPIQKELFSYGRRSYFDTLFNKMLLRMDFVFVSAMAGAEALGYYAMATAAAELMLIIPNSLAVPLFSLLFKKGAGDKEATVVIVLRLLFSGLVLIGIFFCSFGRPLIWLLFGKEYLPGYAPMVLLIPGVIALSYTGLMRLALLGENRPGAVSMISGCCLVVDALLNLWLIPIMGINGAAIAASVAYILGAVALSVMFMKMFNVQLGDMLLLKPVDIRAIRQSVQSKL